MSTSSQRFIPKRRTILGGTAIAAALLSTPLALHFAEANTGAIVQGFQTVVAPAPSSIQLSYPDTEIQAGSQVTLRPAEEFPAGTRFFIGKYEHPVWSTAIDEKTGELTVSAAEGALPGSTLTVGISALFPDFTVNNAIEAKITVGAPEHPVAEQHTPGYENQNIRAGETIVIPQTGDTQLPQGTTFVAGGGADGWVTSVNDNGDLTVTAPEGLQPGANLNAGVGVRYPDGSYAEVRVLITVAE